MGAFVAGRHLTASAAGLSPALKHRDSERRVSAERKAYGLRLVFSSRSVPNHVNSVLAVYTTITLTM